MFVRWCSSLLGLFDLIYKGVIVNDDKESVNFTSATVILSIVARFCSVLRENASFCVSLRLPAVSPSVFVRLSVQMEFDT